MKYFGEYQNIDVLVVSVSDTNPSGDCPVGKGTIRLIEEQNKGRLSIGYVSWIDEGIDPPYSPKASIQKQYPIQQIKNLIEEKNPRYVLLLGEILSIQLIDDIAITHHKGGFKERIGKTHGTFYFQNGRYYIPTYALQQGRKRINEGRKDETLVDDLDIMPVIKRDLERLFTLDPSSIKPPQYKVVNEIPYGFDNKTICFDIESTGLSLSDKIISIAFMDEFSRDIVYILVNPTNEQIQKFTGQLEKASLLVGHNLAFDLSMLYHRYKKDIPNHLSIFDTMVGSHFMGETSLSLKHLTVMNTNRLGNNAYKQGNGFDSLLYVAEDVITTLDLYDKLSDLYRNIFFEQLNDLVIVYANTQYNGIAIDYEYLKNLYYQIKERIKESLTPILEKYPDINVNSNAQLITMLKNEGVKKGFGKTDKGADSLDGASLLDLSTQYKDNVYVQALSEYRELKSSLQFLESYLLLCIYGTDETKDKEGAVAMALREKPKTNVYLNPRFNLTGTTTGRLSSSNPNLQQVSGVIPTKGAMISRYGRDMGRILEYDLSQAEVRVIAYLSGDERFAQACMGDVHLEVARIVWNDPTLSKATEDGKTKRQIAKGIVFALMYGKKPDSVARDLGLDKNQVRQAFDMFFTAFPDLRNWMELQKEQGYANGYLTTDLGRIRYLHNEIQLGRWKSDNVTVNTPVQSLASDVNLAIVWYLSKHIPTGVRFLGSVHDSGLLDVPAYLVDETISHIQNAFWYVGDTILQGYSSHRILPLMGEYTYSDSWGGCNEKLTIFNPFGSGKFSSHR